MSENQIIQGCLEGHRLSQRRLYEAYKVPMFRICLRYATNRTEAEDMLQDGFIRVFTDLHQYKGQGALGGWIRKVIVNSALQYLRKNKKHTATTDIQAIHQTHFAESDIHYQLNAQALTQLIQQLPTGYRLVFNLYVIEGYTHKEIAEQLQININTSKSQLSKAKAALRKKLETIIIQTKP